MPLSMTWSDLHLTAIHSVVLLEWAGPGVGGGVVFPFSVSVSLALEFLFPDVLISVQTSGLLVGGLGTSESNES